MWTRQYKRRKTGRLIVPALACAFLSYFGFHAYHGEYGIYSEIQMEKRAARLRAELEELQDVRTRLERQVQLLHDGTLEKDMLDEQARRALNLARSNEIMILRSSSRP